MTIDASLWFAEPPRAGFQQRFQMKGLLFQTTSPYQLIEIYDSVSFGRMLVLDQAVQLTERDEFTYHEMLVDPALITHPNPSSVLIVGGGDGGTMRRALDHPVKRVVQVEIDARVVEVCRQYLPSVAGGAFSDPRGTLLIDDANRFVAATSEKFDVVLVDSTDPIGPAAVLFSEGFYRRLRGLLSEDGVVATQSGSPLLMLRELLEAQQTMKRVFPLVRTYLACVPCYPGLVWSFTLASLGRDPLEVAKEEITRRLSTLSGERRFYTPDVHAGCFALPRFLQEALEGGTIFEVFGA
ncbi:MAG: polyamine aminopropyltransferase [Chloroflexota bacterium]|nr:MAG: polyamine aminopropyltransferase [Chloroflexota bacterium]